MSTQTVYPITKGEKLAPAWMKLMARTRQRLEMLRSQNDGDQSADDTAKLRGRIAELKAVLAMDNDNPQESAQALRSLPP